MGRNFHGSPPISEERIIMNGFAAIKYSPTTYPSSASTMIKGGYRLWTSHYQASPKSCRYAWNAMVCRNYLPDDAEMKHFFWALYFLKNYSSEIIAARALSTTSKTLRKWVRIMVHALKNLSFDVVSHIWMVQCILRSLQIVF